MAGVTAWKSAPAASFQLPAGTACSTITLTASTMRRSWVRRTLRKRSAWVKSSSCIRPMSPPGWSILIEPSQAARSALASSGPMSALVSPERRSPSLMTRSTIVSTARGSGIWSDTSPCERRASAMAACAHLAALPCSPAPSAWPIRICLRNSSGVRARGVRVKVRPMSTPAWSSEPPTPVPPWVSMYTAAGWFSSRAREPLRVSQMGKSWVRRLRWRGVSDASTA